jgi:hypothetical protein
MVTCVTCHTKELEEFELGDKLVLPTHHRNVEKDPDKPPVMKLCERSGKPNNPKHKVTLTSKPQRTTSLTAPRGSSGNDFASM